MQQQNKQEYTFKSLFVTFKQNNINTANQNKPIATTSFI